MPKGIPNKCYTPEFKQMVAKTMHREKLSNANLFRPQKKQKKYVGIAKALFAYAIDVSLKEGCDGVLIFKAKPTQLVHYYTTEFGAQHAGSYDPFRLVIWEDVAARIIEDYQEEGS